MMKFSIVVPALNEAKYIERCLRSIRKQSFEDFELIVKDGLSKDRTAEIAMKHADHVISRKDFSAGDARNQGARVARGDILVFVDADTILPPNALERFSLLLKNERIVGGSCRKVPDSKSLGDRLFYELTNFCNLLSIPLCIGGAHGNCMFVRKKIFEKVGGFDPRLKIAEEQDLVRKLKRFGKFVFLLDLKVVESPRRVRRVGRLRLALIWLFGTIRSFWGGRKQVYEQVR
jgi:glycosyltransferase involved in cell wall biosynthesis